MGLLTFRKDDSGFCVENTLKGNKDGKKDRSLEASAIILQRRRETVVARPRMGEWRYHKDICCGEQGRCTSTP